MTAVKTFAETVAAIEAELRRLDATDSPENCHGIAVYDSDDEVPAGWVRLSDGYETARGPADEILDALAEVEYDPTATVEVDGDPHTCVDPKCPDWDGEQPDAESPHVHGHGERITQPRDNGWELAWDALAAF